jgi:hypothetical protein
VTFNRAPGYHSRVWRGVDNAYKDHEDTRKAVEQLSDALHELERQEVPHDTTD